VLDFRYHALSLVAVFLALAVGIVLGVTIGDSLLSEAEQGVRNSLRADVVDARNAADDARQAVRARDEFIERVAPGIVRNRLAGRRVAIVSWGELPGGVEDGVRAAVRAAGGRIDSVSQFADPLAELEGALGASQLDSLQEADALDSFGERLGTSIVEGGDITAELRDLDGEGFRGRYLRADAVVLFHAPEEERDEDADAEQLAQLEDGVVAGLRDAATTVVGVEGLGTEPSQVGYFRGRDISSVDSVDTAGGQVALVFALNGAEGAFGFKPGATDPLPDEDELGF